MMITVFCCTFSGCYFINFFKDDKGNNDNKSPAVFRGQVVGRSLGSKAGDADEGALEAIYAVNSDHPPAAIRPDPDLYVRRLLRQYRPEGATIAQQIGRVEEFRLLLGGASEDFSKPPQDSYDATSLLAVYKVAEEVCWGLVAPNRAEHGSWSTILPYGASQEQSNLEWLAQRFIGKPSSEIDTSVIDALLAIMDAEAPSIQKSWRASNNPFAKYVPACAALALDAEALYL